LLKSFRVIEIMEKQVIGDGQMRERNLEPLVEFLSAAGISLDHPLVCPDCLY